MLTSITFHRHGRDMSTIMSGQPTLRTLGSKDNSPWHLQAHLQLRLSTSEKEPILNTDQMIAATSILEDCEFWRIVDLEGS